MVQIVVTSWFPMNKGEEVQKKFLEINQEKGQSPAIKATSMYVSSCKRGWKNVSYNEVEQGNIEEALNFLADFLTGFNVIEGYSYKFSFAVTPEEMAAGQQG